MPRPQTRAVSKQALELQPDSQHRVESGQSVLEYDGDVGAPQFAACLGIQSEEVLSRVADLAPVDHRWWRFQDAHDRVSGDALARAGFADEGEYLAAVKVKVDAIQGMDLTARGVESNVEVLDLK